MSFRPALTAAAVMAMTTPAWAQDPATEPVTAPTPAPAPVAPGPTAEPKLSPEVQALQAEAQAFETAITAMSEELAAVLAAAGDDTARARTDSDAVLAKYQPGIDAFAARVEAAATAEAATLPDPTERAAKEAEGAQAGTMLRGLGPMIRDAAMEQQANPATPAPAQAPTATDTPE